MTAGTTISASHIQGDHLTQNEFNWLGTIFYIFFLAFEYPQNVALQYLPIGKWLSFNIFVWSVALLCHAAADTAAKLYVCRIFLGICEGAITPGFMLVTAMFYTRQEQTQRVGYWCMYLHQSDSGGGVLMSPDSFDERTGGDYARPCRVRDAAYQGDGAHALAMVRP